MRPEIEQALRSLRELFDSSGRVHGLVGIDRLVTDLTPVHEACSRRPSNCVPQVLPPVIRRQYGMVD